MTLSPSRSAAVSLGIACCVLALKWIAFKLTGSVALYSDALESIVNVVAAGAALVALTVAARPADADHPWGHEKAEYFSAGAEGALIVLAAILTVREAVERMSDLQPITSVGLGALVSGGASALNLGLGLWLVRSGRKHRSPALVADGTHVLTDVATSAGVLLGIGLAHWTGWLWLDPVLAIGVALNILFAGWQLARGAVAGLMDEAAPPAEIDALRQLAAKSLPHGVEARILRARHKGSALAVEVRLEVPGAMTVAESHVICDAIELAIQGEHAGSDVVVHVEPR